MGMFDNVIPECPLPDDGADRVREWQTKSFDAPFMDRYRITADGQLLSEVVRCEDRSDPSAEGAMRFVGCMTFVHERWEPMDFTGTVNFYGVPDYGRSGDWYEYDATFVDGRLVKLVAVKRPHAAEVSNG